MLTSFVYTQKSGAMRTLQGVRSKDLKQYRDDESLMQYGNKIKKLTFVIRIQQKHSNTSKTKQE